MDGREGRKREGKEAGVKNGMERKANIGSTSSSTVGSSRSTQEQYHRAPNWSCKRYPCARDEGRTSMVHTNPAEGWKGGKTPLLLALAVPSVDARIGKQGSLLLQRDKTRAQALAR